MLPVSEYPGEMKLKDALEVYFNKYHFPNGGYEAKYFHIKLGPVLIPVPNTRARIIAVKFHDLHHVITGYSAHWKGETEIGAWEVASGCGKHWVAWILNFGSFFVGFYLYPKSIYKAFMNGRSVRKNLYTGYVYDGSLLQRTAKELRDEMGTETQKAISRNDVFLFICWCTTVILVTAFYLLLLTKTINFFI
jgi:hypothetical protein